MISFVCLSGRCGFSKDIYVRRFSFIAHTVCDMVLFVLIFRNDNYPFCCVQDMFLVDNGCYYFCLGKVLNSKRIVLCEHAY